MWAELTDSKYRIKISHKHRDDIYFHINRKLVDLVKEDHALRSMSQLPKYQVAPQFLFGIYVLNLLPNDAPSFSTRTENSGTLHRKPQNPHTPYSFIYHRRYTVLANRTIPKWSSSLCPSTGLINKSSRACCGAARKTKTNSNEDSRSHVIIETGYYKSSERLWGPSSHLFSGYMGSFPG